MDDYSYYEIKDARMLNNEFNAYSELDLSNSVINNHFNTPYVKRQTEKLENGEYELLISGFFGLLTDSLGVVDNNKYALWRYSSPSFLNQLDPFNILHFNIEDEAFNTFYSPNSYAYGSRGSKGRDVFTSEGPYGTANYDYVYPFVRFGIMDGNGSFKQQRVTFDIDSDASIWQKATAIITAERNEVQYLGGSGNTVYRSWYKQMFDITDSFKTLTNNYNRESELSTFLHISNPVFPIHLGVYMNPINNPNYRAAKYHLAPPNPPYSYPFRDYLWNMFYPFIKPYHQYFIENPLSSGAIQYAMRYEATSIQDWIDSYYFQYDWDNIDFIPGPNGGYYLLPRDAIDWNNTDQYDSPYKSRYPYNPIPFSYTIQVGGKNLKKTFFRQELDDHMFYDRFRANLLYNHPSLLPFRLYTENNNSFPTHLGDTLIGPNGSAYASGDLLWSYQQLPDTINPDGTFVYSNYWQQKLNPDSYRFPGNPNFGVNGSYNFFTPPQISYDLMAAHGNTIDPRDQDDNHVAWNDSTFLRIATINIDDDGELVISPPDYWTMSI